VSTMLAVTLINFSDYTLVYTVTGKAQKQWLMTSRATKPNLA